MKGATSKLSCPWYFLEIKVVTEDGFGWGGGGGQDFQCLKRLKDAFMSTFSYLYFAKSALLFYYWLTVRMCNSLTVIDG